MGLQTTLHGIISRREFLDRASGFAVAGLLGTALLDAVNPKFAEVQQVAPADARLMFFPQTKLKSCKFQVVMQYLYPTETFLLPGEFQLGHYTV